MSGWSPTRSRTTQTLTLPPSPPLLPQGWNPLREWLEPYSVKDYADVFEFTDQHRMDLAGRVRLLP